jgi:hypothetical protein
MTSVHSPPQSSILGVKQCTVTAPVPANGPRYFVRQQAFICQVRRHWIILDVHTDQYFCIPSRDFSALGPLIHGWQCDTRDVPFRFPEHTEALRALAEQLVAKGVLCETRESARELSVSPITLPTSILDAERVSIRVRQLMLYAPSFFFSCLTADRRLRRRNFESIVRSVQVPESSYHRAATSSDLQKMRTLVSTFNVLRLWYPRSYLCLFDSLALLLFLSLHGLYPRWTFGVMADPFQAHCWLQEGSVLLNDSLARVSAYTPIMAV